MRYQTFETIEFLTHPSAAVRENFMIHIKMAATENSMTRNSRCDGTRENTGGFGHKQPLPDKADSAAQHDTGLSGTVQHR